MANGKKSELHIALVGDVNIGSPINPDTVLDLVKRDFNEFDASIGNLEGCLFDPAVVLEHKPGWHHCDEAHIKVLAELNFHAMACANNVHFGKDAIKHSLSRLTQYNIAHAGAGMTRQEARSPAIFDLGGTKFGLLSYTSVFWPVGQVASETRAGVASVKIYTSYQPHRRLFEMPGAPPTTLTYPDESEFDDLKKDVAVLREKVDVLIVYFHWGVSGQYEICQYQSTLGKAAIESGADLIVGSHPHVVQSVEIYKGKPIFYSLGNFLFGSDFKPARGYRNGLVVIPEVRNGEVIRVLVVPSTINDKEQPSLLNPDQAESRVIMERIIRSSSSFGTKFTRQGERFLVEGS